MKEREKRASDKRRGAAGCAKKASKLRAKQPFGNSSSSEIVCINRGCPSVSFFISFCCKESSSLLLLLLLLVLLRSCHHRPCLSPESFSLDTTTHPRKEYYRRLLSLPDLRWECVRNWFRWEEWWRVRRVGMGPGSSSVSPEWLSKGCCRGRSPKAKEQQCGEV